jgi:hypothetical protein
MRTLLAIIATVLAALLIATPAAAQTSNDAATRDDTSLHIALGAFGAAQGADLATTMYALGRGGFREVNPVFRPLSDHPALAGATKMGVAVATQFLLMKVHATHPRLAFWLSTVGAGAYSAIAIHNAVLIQRQ